jgi:hypothetical protein
MEINFSYSFYQILAFRHAFKPKNWPFNMDIYDILERGKELDKAGNRAWNQGDVIGIANNLQAKSELETQILSEPIPQRNFGRIGTYILGGLSAIGLALTGAAKDIAPSLEEPVIYQANSNENIEELFTVDNIICDDVYTKDHDRIGMFEKVECSFDVKQNNESEPDFYISFIDFDSPVEEGDGSGRISEQSHISFQIREDQDTISAPVYLNNTNKDDMGNTLRHPSYEPNKDYYLIVHENQEDFQFKGKDGYFHPDNVEFNYSGPHNLKFLEEAFNQKIDHQSEDDAKLTGTDVLESAVLGLDAAVCGMVILYGAMIGYNKLEDLSLSIKHRREKKRERKEEKRLRKLNDEGYDY